LVFVDLVGRGLAVQAGEGWALTEEGLRLAGALRAARPPIWYWYRECYAAIEHSVTFGEYCARVFGRGLSQHGFRDLGELEQALALGPAGADCSWLDVGCSNGKIAEYVAARTGARVLGIDNVPEAISAAHGRWARPSALPGGPPRYPGSGR
jgi:methylase of polypeptide subunit release factors